MPKQIKSEVIFYPGRIKEGKVDESQLSVNKDVESLTREWRGLAERLCQSLPTTNKKPIFKIADPVQSKETYTLPSVEVKLPDINPEFTDLLNPREYSPVSDKSKLTWKFSLTKFNSGKNHSKKKTSTENNQEDNDGEILEEKKSNKFNFTITDPHSSFPVGILGLEEVCDKFTEYLGQLLRCGTFPLNKTAKKIYGDQDLNGKDFAALREKYKDSLDREIARIYEVLDKFINGNLTVNNLAKQYPNYSLQKLIKLIDNKDQLVQDLSSLDLDDYSWNNSTFCQVMVDLQGNDLKIFEQAIKELKVEHPELLADFEFTIVNPANAKTSGPTALDSAQYIDNFISNAKPKRKNIILIGNPRTDYGRAVASGISNSASHGLSSIGFFGLARIWGTEDQKSLFDQISLGADEIGNFGTPFMNIVGLANKLKKERIAEDRLAGKITVRKRAKATEEKKTKKKNENEDLTAVDYDSYARAGLQDIRIQSKKDSVAILKDRLLDLFQAPQLGHGVLKSKISPQLRQFINENKTKANLSDFNGDTVLSIFLWHKNAEHTNLELLKLYNDKNFLLNLIQLTGDSVLKSEIRDLCDKIQIASQLIQKETKPSLEDLTKHALPLFSNNHEQNDSVQAVSTQVVNNKVDDAKIKELVDRLTIWKAMPWKFVLRGAHFTEEFKQIASPALTKGVNIIDDSKITDQASELLRANNINGFSEDQKYQIATRILMALKNPEDEIWRGTSPESRKIPPTSQLREIAKSLISLGVMDYGVKQNPKPVKTAVA